MGGNALVRAPWVGYPLCRLAFFARCDRNFARFMAFGSGPRLRCLRRSPKRRDAPSVDGCLLISGMARRRGIRNAPGLPQPFPAAPIAFQLFASRSQPVRFDFPSHPPAIQSRRRVTVCSSHAVRVPAAIGYFRPIVVFPAWTLQEIPAAELDAILLHELAHIRRWDDWTNLAQKIIKAIFFFHPAVG